MASTICGWCGDRTHMTMVLDPYELPPAVWPTDRSGSRDRDRPVYMAAFKCSNENCERLSVGWTSLHRPTMGHPKHQFPRERLEWEPVKARRPEFPDVPEQIAATASEAHACLSIGAAKGAVALARAVVEATGKAKGVASIGIQSKINALRDAQIISPLTAATSERIRKDGNSIAHGDIGDEPISVDDATAILEFMDELLDEVFQRPAKLQRLQQRGEERKAGNLPGQQLPPAPGGGPA
ncbi:DUF4145 domain-containing protein (plasmid) [Streptomyces cynarae]|uniref:DUF4145 domain-containing protein n=1 Tax=Streptomyces cynarae TaxID=2981134 RepID=A0ABY6EE78_9ACTN|nr:DUF4145 domain-containing protein [Streptomyces cynarae]UXY24954.1 DUF4145 domain-containing protein [Streptomyces cynarae]